MRPETRHSAILTVGTGTAAALSLVYSVYAGRVLGPAGYADFAAALVFASLCNIALGPINGTVARFAAQYAARGEAGRVRALHDEVSRRVALYSAAAMVVGLAALKPLADVLHFRSVAPLLTAFVIVVLTLLLSVGRGVLRGVQSFGAYSVNIVAEALVRLGIGCAMFAILPTATGGLGAYVLALAITYAILHGQLRGVWRGHTLEPLDGAAIRRFVVPMFVMMGVSAGFENIDLLFVKGLFGESDAGAYGAAFVLTRVIAVAATPFHILMLPLLTSLHERGRGLAGAFARVCVYFLLLAGAPLILFWLWSGPIVRALYGSDFGGAAELLLPLAGARLIGYLSGMIALLNASTGRFRFLWLYVPAMAAQALILAVWHGTLMTVVAGILVVQGATLLGMGACSTLRPFRTRGEPPSCPGSIA